MLLGKAGQDGSALLAAAKTLELKDFFMPSGEARPFRDCHPALL
jgi:hypothetical protein